MIFLQDSVGNAKNKYRIMVNKENYLYFSSESCCSLGDTVNFLSIANLINKWMNVRLGCDSSVSKFASVSDDTTETSESGRLIIVIPFD